MTDALTATNRFPECPGPECPLCNGSECNLCGRGCWTKDSVRCEHNNDERHADPVFGYVIQQAN